MEKKEKELIKLAKDLGYHSRGKNLYDLVDWLREEKQIHVEVGSIWDELTNSVESYCFTITAPVNVYFFEPVYVSGGKTHEEMLNQGLFKALEILRTYDKQKNIRVSDDEVVIAYLKGYGDKHKTTAPPQYHTYIEKYAYLLGRQGDYIEEGLTEDDILILVKNISPEEEALKLENRS
ncbi:hypothetical protein [Salinimicrobium sp. HB62]|uniref:hypothetical protein n=1 Tax=Salinimicrobium sp. HB62 TaxID=3077781 RepID=UPI002D767CB4|nr:hypothetical protein [Salinimicrobium sp. HB62]